MEKIERIKEYITKNVVKSRQSFKFGPTRKTTRKYRITQHKPESTFSLSTPTLSHASLVLSLSNSPSLPLSLFIIACIAHTLFVYRTIGNRLRWIEKRRIVWNDHINGIRNTRIVKISRDQRGEPNQDHV